MKTRIIIGDELARVAEAIIRETPEMLSIMVIGGDRIRCCDEGVVCADDPSCGIATIAPDGEMGSGKPTIVGLFVRPDARKKSVGTDLFEAAVRRCLERGFDRIHIDAMTKGMIRIIANMSPDLRVHLDVNDQSKYFPF